MQVLARDARGSTADARGILQIIPLERCPWLVYDVRDVVLARTCTRLLHETRKAKPGQAWLTLLLLPRPLPSVRALQNRAMPGRTGFDRTTWCIYRRRVYIRTGHRPRIIRVQFAHIKPITCFGRVIREFCPDCATQLPTLITELCFTIILVDRISVSLLDNST